MTPELQAYSKTLTKTYVDSGVPQSIAKILVYLIVCTPSRQTAPMIQQQLALSAGSVSTALNVLLRAGLIIRHRTVGDKHYYYELDNDAWRRSILQRLSAIDTIVALAEQGIQIMPGNQRLTGMRDVYQYFSDEAQHIMASLDQQKNS